MRGYLNLYVAIILLPALSVAQVTIDGYAYLENQSEHSGIQVVFEMTAPNSLTDTSTTDASGYFTAQLEIGIYNVSYSKDGYFSESLTNQPYTSNTTLSTITLIEHTTLINVPSLFSTIQSAINHSFSGDTILVQPDTYLENINYNGKSIVVGSLFITNSDTSFISSTIIDANNSGTVVGFSNNESNNAVLDGFTIKNGYGFTGAGIKCTNASPTLRNLIVTDNTAYGSGSGMYCLTSSPIIENIIIINNHAANAGGGIALHYNSNPTMINVVVSNNTADDGVGGIELDLSNPVMNNVVVSNNVGGSGRGGIAISSSNTAQFVNVTITNNQGYGIWTDWGNPSLKNCIISNNTGTGIILWGEWANPSINYSNVYNNAGGNFYGFDFSVGNNLITNANGDSCDVYYNIQEDPMFVGEGDYNLQESSPCIDAGDPSSPLDPDGTAADMGAYYYDQIENPIIWGCTDSTATNYNPDATEDDGSCCIELWGECYSIENTTELNLSISGLTGSIPPEIGNLTNLITLDLSENQLSGIIPDEICNQGDSYPGLSYNQLCPPYPSCIEDYVGNQDTSDCDCD